jgi:hypothetical protein
MALPKEQPVQVVVVVKVVAVLVVVVPVHACVEVACLELLGVSCLEAFLHQVVSYLVGKLYTPEAHLLLPRHLILSASFP